jgi:hypothetical protein
MILDAGIKATPPRGDKRLMEFGKRLRVRLNYSKFEKAMGTRVDGTVISNISEGLSHPLEPTVESLIRCLTEKQRERTEPTLDN